MVEAHYSRYAIHIGFMTMYNNINEIYKCFGIKNDIVDFKSQYPNYYQVKFEHHKPSALNQKIPIPLWKWKEINMDFVTHLPLILLG